MAKPKSRLKSLKSGTTPIDLYYKIANVKNVVGATIDERWLEFDIMVKSDKAGIYLDNAIVHFEYETNIKPILN